MTYDSDELKEIFKLYIKENLTVEVDVGYDGYYGGRCVKVILLLEGEEFSNHYDSLPRH